MDILRQYVRSTIVETVITGRKLERYARIITHEVIQAVKDPEVRDYFVEHGLAQFSLQGVTALNDIDYLRDVIIVLEEGPEISASAGYEFDLDATPEQRRDSDLRVSLTLPTRFSDRVLGHITEELIDAVRHELEHSSQSTETLMGVHDTIKSEDDIWSSLEGIEAYYVNQAETPAHVAGWVQRAKNKGVEAADVIDEELYNIYATALDKGHSEKALQPLMKKLRDIYQYYLMKRWPEQDWPIEMRDQ